jgi:DNA-binding GntR family transcriptional regulator
MNDRVTTRKKQIRSLREEIYEHLRTMMSDGRLRPGAYLDLNGLADEIGISRTPLRDALLRLECEGFVEILNRRGVRIVELTPTRIRWIYELLGGLESAALRSVASRVNSEVVSRMEDLNQDMVRALDEGDFAWFYQDNLAFHDSYLGLSDNPELIRQAHLLKQRLYDFPRLKGFVPEWERASILEHARLVGLLREGRATAAADFLRDVHWCFEYQEPFIRRYYTLSSGGEPPED